MATIVNPRDIALQATNPRLVPVTLPDNIIIPAVKSIRLSAPSNTFQVSSAGVASPTSILLTAKLRQIAGTVVFSVVEGTATLTGAGNTRTLSYSGAGSDSVTVRASVTEDTIVYESEFTIAKVRDGSVGTNGTRTAVLEMYRWSSVAPTTYPAGSSTYTWATGQFTQPTTLNSWNLVPPAAVAGQTLYVVRQVFADSLTTATSAITWAATSSIPAGAAGTNGANGQRVGVLEVYQWSFNIPTTYPSGSSTYTWATGAFTAPSLPNSWSLLPGAPVAGQTLWGISVSVSDALATATSVASWASTSVYAVGAAGETGTRGSRQLYLVDGDYISSYNAYANSAAVAIAAAANASGSTPTTPISGDTVTFSNGTTYTYTLTYNGTAWAPPGTVIDGNLLVTGSVSASKLTVGSITTGSGGTSRVQIGNYGTVGTYTASMSAIKLSSSPSHVLIAATNGSDNAVCMWGHNYASGASGNGVSGSHSAAAALTSWSRIGILGSGSYGAAVAGITYAGGSGGYFEYRTGSSNLVPGSPANWVNLATSTHAIQAAGAISSSGGLGVNGKAAQASATVNTACTDLATAVALINQLRAALVANGICV